MCSKGVSVWFACKLCKRFFLNADDSAYHKKKSHLEEFRNKKFIVFEEQTNPPASPPENWVSFLSPKEETLIHKIISSPPTPTSTSTSTVTNVDCSLRNENIQRNRNKEFIEIDLESKSYIIFNDDNGENHDSDEVSNNRLDLNYIFNPNNDTNKAAFSTQEKVPLQNKITLTSNVSRLTDEQQGIHYLPTINKSTLQSKPKILKIGKRKIGNNARNYHNILKTVIQSPRNPYVRLERLNLLTIQNRPSSFNSNVHSHENDKCNANHDNLNANIGMQPSVADADQENIIESSSTLTSTPLRTVRNCKFCSEFFDSTAAEFDIHQDSCQLKRPCENIICVKCLLTFTSFDELNTHNCSCHSTSVSATAAETTGSHRSKSGCFNPRFDCDSVSNADNNSSVDIEVDILEEKIVNQTSGNKRNKSVFRGHSFKSSSESIPPDANDALKTSTSILVYHKCRLCRKIFKSDVFRKHIELCKNANYSNQKRQSDLVFDTNLIPVPVPVPDPTTIINLDCSNLLEVVKTEYVADNANQDNEFSLEDHDPFDSESQDKSLAVKETLSVAEESSSNTVDELHIPQASLYCVCCNKKFIHIQDIRKHNKNYHDNLMGKPRIECPHPNCGKTITHRRNLQRHIQQVHLNVRPFKCPHPNCTKSFKEPGSRNKHLKSHTNWSKPTCSE